MKSECGLWEALMETLGEGGDPSAAFCRLLVWLTVVLSMLFKRNRSQQFRSSAPAEEAAGGAVRPVGHGRGSGRVD